MSMSKNLSNYVMQVRIWDAFFLPALIFKRVLIIDYKKNNETGEEDEVEEFDDDLEYDDDLSTEEWQGDDDTLEVDYDKEPTDDDYLEEDNFYQEDDSGYKARNASEYADLQ